MKYQPGRIRLLLVAEAPPSATDRYFYFPNVAFHDSLFRYVARLVLGVEPTRYNKSAILSQFRDAGVFLIDLCLDPIADKRDLRGCVGGLIARARALDPERVILIKATVFDAAYRAMEEAGIPVVGRMIPFPGSGQQRRFEEEMGLALRSIAWTARE